MNEIPTRKDVNGPILTPEWEKHLEGIGGPDGDFFREIVLRFTRYTAVEHYRSHKGGGKFQLATTFNVADCRGCQCGGGQTKRLSKRGYGKSFLFFSLMPDWKRIVWKTGHYITQEGWLVLALRPDPTVPCVDEAFDGWVAAQGRGHSLVRKRRWLVRKGDQWAMRETANQARLELLARSDEVKALGLDVDLKGGTRR